MSNMTNEEKSRELVGYDIDTPRSLMRMEACDEYDDLIKMAEWKDQQIKEILEKRKAFYENKVSAVPAAIVAELNEILNELFGETE